MGMKQLDLRLPVDQARDAAQSVFGDSIGASECFGEKQQGLLDRGRQVREAQDLAHTRARDVPELRYFRMIPQRALRQEMLEPEGQSHEPAHSRNSPQRWLLLPSAPHAGPVRKP